MRPASDGAFAEDAARSYQIGRAAQEIMRCAPLSAPEGAAEGAFDREIVPFWRARR